MRKLREIVVETLNEALRAVDRYEETCDKVTWEPVEEGGYVVKGFVQES